MTKRKKRNTKASNARKAKRGNAVAESAGEDEQNLAEQPGGEGEEEDGEGVEEEPTLEGEESPHDEGRSSGGRREAG